MAPRRPTLTPGTLPVTQVIGAPGPSPARAQNPSTGQGGATQTSGGAHPGLVGSTTGFLTTSTGMGSPVPGSSHGGGGGTPPLRAPETPERLRLLVSAATRASGLEDSQGDPDNPAVPPSQFKRIQQFTFELFPQSKGDLHAPGVSKSQVYPSLSFLDEAASASTSSSLPFHEWRASPPLQETRDRVIRECQSRASQGKTTLPASVLGSRKRYHAFSEDPAKEGPVKLNRLFADHIQEKAKLHSGKATMPFTVEDSLAVENGIAASIETLNTLFWMFSSLSSLALVPDMKDRFHQLFVSLVNSINTGHKQLAKELLASQLFFSSRRREFFLSHAPPNLGEVQKKDLRISSVDAPLLFNQDHLEAAFKEANLKSSQRTPGLSPSESLPWGDNLRKL